LGSQPSLRYKLEPAGYQLHLWQEDIGLVTHTAVLGDWPGPFPLRPS
jgi:3',5'-cyclic-AMP phosphodiesterase